MNKFMDNPWFIRIIALALSILLFVSINDIGKGTETNPNGMESVDSETIPNVPVRLYYDAENLVVTGIPETVDIKVEGQRRFVEAAKRQRDFEVYIDLSDVEIGKHRVPVLYKDISEKLKVKVEPGYADISVQEKVTDDYRVEAEFNRSILADGFEADSPEISPKTVKITGAKDVMDRIAYVKATIDAGGLISETIKKDAPVNVLDKELNKLDVIVQPGSVSVTIPVKNPRKTVPVKIKTTGKAKDDMTISSMTSEIKEIVIFGRTDTLEAIKEVEAVVDISDVSGDTEKEASIKLPAGVNKAMPEKIKVKIKADQKTGETTLNDVQIKETGLDPNLEIKILDPESGKVSVTVTGQKTDVEKAAAAGVSVTMNVSGLAAGEHDVDLAVINPLAGVQYSLSAKKARISLIEKENV